MGLFDLFKKKESKKTYDNRLDKLDPDGELPFGWAYKYRDFTDAATAEYMFFSNQYFESKRNRDPQKIYAATKSLLTYIEDAKKRYAAMGECFIFWFVAMWATDRHVQELIAELEHLETHMDELMKKYKRDQFIENVLIPEIKEKAISIIKDNPGMLQTDMYSHFEERSKGFVQTALYQLSNDGKIKREKHGRTYKLTL